MQNTSQGEIDYWFFRAYYDNGEREDLEFEIEADCLRYVRDYAVQRAGECLSDTDEDEKKVIDQVISDAKEFDDIGDGQGIWNMAEYLSETYEWEKAKLLRYGRTNIDKLREAVADGKG